MYHNMEHADIIRKMTEEFDEVKSLVAFNNTLDVIIWCLIFKYIVCELLYFMWLKFWMLQNQESYF